MLGPGLTFGLVKANREVSEEDRLPEDEIIAQMSYVRPSAPCPMHIDISAGPSSSPQLTQRPTRLLASSSCSPSTRTCKTGYAPS